jgi:hypothetical protein
MKVKEVFFSRGSFKIGNGANTRFWEDCWLGDAPLSHQFPSMYNIVNRKQVYVDDILVHRPLIVTFRRTLTPNKWAQWLQIVEGLMHV